jgi:hypothetical protein
MPSLWAAFGYGAIDAMRARFLAIHYLHSQALASWPELVQLAGPLPERLAELADG